MVATPIGNLEDLTPRARDALSRAEAVLCEDTRRTSKLLAALGVRATLKRFDAHSSDREVESVVSELRAGKTFALVTDAGTPAISDPGALLVQEARKAGVAVTPIPGVSAVATLLSVCGFIENEFTFRGFFPRKKSERERELKSARLSAVSRVFAWFESPERIAESLELIAGIEREFGAALTVCVAKELTKIYEKSFWGSASEVSHAVLGEIKSEGARGEWCFAIRFPEQRAADSESIEQSEGGAGWHLALQCLLDSNIAPSEAVKRVSHRFGIGKKAVYDLALKLSGKLSDKKNEVGD